MTSPGTQDRFPNQPLWPKSEKAIARKAFDAALKGELHEVIQKAKRRCNQIKEPSELWDLERYLTRRRKEIDDKYQFRSSRRSEVLGRLLQESRLSEEELRGLPEHRLESIRSYARFLAKMAAA